MLMLSIIFLLSSNAATLRRDKSIPYVTLVLTSVIYCFLLAFIGYMFNSILVLVLYIFLFDFITLLAYCLFFFKCGLSNWQVTLNLLASSLIVALLIFPEKAFVGFFAQEVHYPCIIFINGIVWLYPLIILRKCILNKSPVVKVKTLLIPCGIFILFWIFTHSGALTSIATIPGTVIVTLLPWEYLEWNQTRGFSSFFSGDKQLARIGGIKSISKLSQGESIIIPTSSKMEQDLVLIPTSCSMQQDLVLIPTRALSSSFSEHKQLATIGGINYISELTQDKTKLIPTSLSMQGDGSDSSIDPRLGGRPANPSTRSWGTPANPSTRSWGTPANPSTSLPVNPSTSLSNLELQLSKQILFANKCRENNVKLEEQLAETPGDVEKKRLWEQNKADGKRNLTDMNRTRQQLGSKASKEVESSLHDIEKRERKPMVDLDIGKIEAAVKTIRSSGAETAENPYTESPMHIGDNKVGSYGSLKYDMRQRKLTLKSLSISSQEDLNKGWVARGQGTNQPVALELYHVLDAHRTHFWVKYGVSTVAVPSIATSPEIKAFISGVQGKPCTGSINISNKLLDDLINSH